MRLDISVDLWWRLMVEKRFTNKVVIVTGGSQGIGLACAKRFQDEGATVCVIQRSKSENFDIEQCIPASFQPAECQI